jgi:hypothetical protein
MAKINSPAIDKQKDALEITAELMQNVSITTDPVVITAVQRKANIGNFETIDVYAAVAMPLRGALDGAEINAALAQAFEDGFSLVARETAERYHKIKESLK